MFAFIWFSMGMITNIALCKIFKEIIIYDVFDVNDKVSHSDAYMYILAGVVIMLMGPISLCVAFTIGLVKSVEAAFIHYLKRGRVPNKDIRRHSSENGF